MMSTFAIVILLMLAAAVSNNYRCVGDVRRAALASGARVPAARLRRPGGR